jgi:hypothetical protein
MSNLERELFIFGPENDDSEYEYEEYEFVEGIDEDESWDLEDEDMDEDY